MAFDLYMLACLCGRGCKQIRVFEQHKPDAVVDAAGRLIVLPRR